MFLKAHPMVHIRSERIHLLGIEWKTIEDLPILESMGVHYYILQLTY